MKKRLEQLIDNYRDMLKRTRSKIRRECLENVIADLEVLLAEAQ
jgi:predicted DNA-binding protein